MSYFLIKPVIRPALPISIVTQTKHVLIALLAAIRAPKMDAPSVQKVTNFFLIKPVIHPARALNIVTQNWIVRIVLRTAIRAQLMAVHNARRVSIVYKIQHVNKIAQSTSMPIQATFVKIILNTVKRLTLQLVRVPNAYSMILILLLITCLVASVRSFMIAIVTNNEWATIASIYPPTALQSKVLQVHLISARDAWMVTSSKEVHVR